VYRRQPDTPETRRALLETLDRPGATVHVYERDDSPLINGLIRDGLVTGVLRQDVHRLRDHGPGPCVAPRPNTEPLRAPSVP
jgi:hypothetical protein